MSKLKVIDCNACIGLATVNRLIINHENYPVVEKVKQAKNSQELLCEMDFCGIDEAVVYHQAMYDTAPDYGNKLFLKDKSNYSGRLKGTFTILPSICDKGFEVENIFKTMKENNLVGLRAYPLQNRFMLDKITVGDLLEAMIASNIPLYLSPMDGWDYIFNVLKEFPKLTIILYNYGLWGSDRFFYPLINAYENVFIDTSDYQVMDGLRTFINKFSSKKLLFGSNFPMDNMGGPLATLLLAKISDEDKENIAHKNIENLLSKVRYDL